MIHDPNDEATNDTMTRKPQVVTQLCLIFAGAADEYYFADYSYTVWCAVLSTARWAKAVKLPRRACQTAPVTENNGGNFDGWSLRASRPCIL